MSELTRPIIGIENRTPQEVFDIMCDRITRTPAPLMSEEAEKLWQALAAFQSPDGTWMQVGKSDFLLALSSDGGEG